MHQADAVFQAIIFDIDGGHFQRIQAQINGIDLCIGIVVRHLNG